MENPKTNVKNKKKKNSDDSDDLDESDEAVGKNNKEKVVPKVAILENIALVWNLKAMIEAEKRNGNADFERDGSSSSYSSPTSSSSDSDDDNEDDDIFGGSRGGPSNGFNSNGMGGTGAGYKVNSITRQAKKLGDAIDQCANYVHDCTADEFQSFMNTNCKGTCDSLGSDGQDVAQNCNKIRQLCSVDTYQKDMQKFCAATCHPELRSNNPAQFGGGNAMQFSFP